MLLFDDCDFVVVVSSVNYGDFEIAANLLVLCKIYVKFSDRIFEGNIESLSFGLDYSKSSFLDLIS